MASRTACSSFTRRYSGADYAQRTAWMPRYYCLCGSLASGSSSSSSLRAVLPSRETLDMISSTRAGLCFPAANPRTSRARRTSWTGHSFGRLVNAAARLRKSGEEGNSTIVYYGEMQRNSASWLECFVNRTLLTGNIVEFGTQIQKRNVTTGQGCTVHNPAKRND